uniref:type II secretion system F family protein n=1 Tax=uncultured Erythrobacter sp. TaxID=263913 RepID=UPI00260BD7B9|nr:type II secretion system F family protein [uncultured Erythrobacter sp.]
MSTEIIRAIILLVVFAAIFLLASVFLNEWQKRRVHTQAVNKRLEMIERGTNREAVVGELIKRRPAELSFLPQYIRQPLLSFQRLVFASGISMTYRTVLVLLAAASAALFFITLVVLVLSGIALSFGSIQLTLMFSIALGILVPVFILQRMAQAQRKKMEQQFPVALDIFVRALRTGHPVSSAIDLLTEEMEDPIGSEFGLISDEVAYGAELIDALSALAERWDLEDIRMFVVALSLQQQTGGNLAEILENISKVIRERAQLYMKVRALSSEGRMTGWMLTILPVFAFVTIFLGTPEYYFDVADDPVFIFGSITLSIMYVTGVIVIRKMVDLKV